MTFASLMYPVDPNMWITNMCEPGGLEAWLKENKTTDLAPWMTTEEIQKHAQILKAGGYTGPLNWYKQAMAGITHASELKMNPSYKKTVIDTPTLFIGTAKDVICIPALQEAAMKSAFTNLTVETLDTGHWVMLEKPKEMWDVLSGFIDKNTK